MKDLFLVFLFIFAGVVEAKYYSFNSKVFEQHPRLMNVMTLGGDVSISSDITKIREELHHFGCPGYIAHDTLEEALDFSTMKDRYETSWHPAYELVDHHPYVEMGYKAVKEKRIRETIIGLSKFKNRYYKSESGVAASNFVYDTWKNAFLEHGRKDVTIEKYSHRSYPQKSIILKIRGQVNPEQVVIVGGHLDSIAGYWGRRQARAPGADDNASGIATLTEGLRVLMELSWTPQSSVHFIAYAGEELGLLGSKDIARDYKEKKEYKVRGVLQFDMTNFRNGDISLISDYTDKNLSSLVGNLIDRDLGISWGRSKCGYACSDHASWYKNGFPVAFPFETDANKRNRKIHTQGDTLEYLGGEANHAAIFTKILLSFVLELSK